MNDGGGENLNPKDTNAMSHFLFIEQLECLQIDRSSPLYDPETLDGTSLQLEKKDIL